MLLCLVLAVAANLGKEKKNSEILALLYQSIHGGAKPGAKVGAPMLNPNAYSVCMLTADSKGTHRYMSDEPPSILAAQHWKGVEGSAAHESVFLGGAQAR